MSDLTTIFASIGGVSVGVYIGALFGGVMIIKIPDIKVRLTPAGVIWATWMAIVVNPMIKGHFTDGIGIYGSVFALLGEPLAMLPMGFLFGVGLMELLRANYDKQRTSE